MHCDLHPERASADVCTNCAGFMCLSCSEDSTELRCPACRSGATLRAGEGGALEVLQRSSGGLGALCAAAWGGFTREPLMLVLAAFITIASTLAAQALLQMLKPLVTAAGTTLTVLLVLSALLLALLQLLVRGALQMGQTRLSARALAARPPGGLGPLFGQWRKAPRYVACALLIALGIAALMLIPYFVVMLLEAWDPSGAALEGRTPRLVTLLVMAALLLWLTLPLLLLTQVLAFEEREGPLSALQRCYALAHRRRLLLLGTGMVSLGALGLGLLACCVGVIPASAFVETLWTAAYLRLREDEALPYSQR